MCFIVKTNRKYIAKKDIKVFKEVSFYNSKICYSSCMGFKYIKNKLTRKIRLQIDSFGEIHEGYHSHSRREFGCNAVFIIPKGSEYYYSSRYSERVSNQIIFKELIERK